MVSHIDLSINVAIFYLEVATLAITEKDKKRKTLLCLFTCCQKQRQKKSCQTHPINK